MTDSTVSGNSATNGGGLFNDGTFGVPNYYYQGPDAQMTLSNVTISGNSSESLGGGLLIFGPFSTVTMDNITISDNSANEGGGLASFNHAHSLKLTNTIVAGQDSGGDLSGDSIDPSSTNNLIGGDPLLAPLGDYGGPTQTMPLLPGSPAIDAGTTGDGIPTTDQRGVPRVGGVDIGAFESQGFVLSPVAGSTPQQTIIGTPFINPLVVSVTANNAIEPVNGGVVGFTVNPAANVASATLSATTAVINDGQAGVNATANRTVGAYSVTASANGASPTAFFLTNTYQTVAVFDQTKPHHANSTIPIKIQVTDALGNNLGSTSLAALAVLVIGPDGNPVPLMAPGNSQPDDLFRYDPETGTYQFNLKTKGYVPGTYTLWFQVGEDPTLHGVQFVIG
jgi:hypothetical protein